VTQTGAVTGGAKLRQPGRHGVDLLRYHSLTGEAWVVASIAPLKVSQESVWAYQDNWVF
jgi:hypothetical protein